MIIRELTVQEYEGVLPQLTSLLIDAVNSNAGVSFMHPLSPDIATAFWRKQVGDVSTGAIHHFVAEDNSSIVGTVLLHKAWAPNQPHRGEISKMLVHSSRRRQGIGRKLLETVEQKARGLGLSLITFDAVAHGRTEFFYKEAGYVVAGYYPGYALSPQGELDDTALFYKQLV
jgi:GNAT superfamily N-acetyltransferase